MQTQPIEKIQQGWRGVRGTLPSGWINSAQIEGQIPLDLFGTFYRNGPGLLRVYDQPLKHPIDGDGLVCALSFKSGRVHFQSAFVNTRSHIREREAKKFIYRGQMGTQSESLVGNAISLASSFARSGKPPRIHFREPANTNVFYWGGKLLACYETSLPYSLSPNSLGTTGPEDFNGTLRFNNFAAHYRIDADQKRLVGISLRPSMKGPATVAIYEFDRHWETKIKKEVKVPGLNYIHDFLITPDWYIFHKTPFARFETKLALKIGLGLSSPGESMRYYRDLPSEFVFVSRNSDADPICVKTDPFHIFHFGNVEQINETLIRFNAVCLGKKFNMNFDRRIWLSNASKAPGKMYEFELDLKTRVCKGFESDPASMEFPTGHPWRHGKKCRYLYCMASDRENQNLPYQDMVKYDSERENRSVFRSQGCLGEPVFVPKQKDSERAPEDEGWVIVQEYLPQSDRTNFLILDAQDPASGPLATIKLDQRIPFGFHGTFWPNVFIDP